MALITQNCKEEKRLTRFAARHNKLYAKTCKDFFSSSPSSGFKTGFLDDAGIFLFPDSIKSDLVPAHQPPVAGDDREQAGEPSPLFWRDTKSDNNGAAVAPLWPDVLFRGRSGGPVVEQDVINVPDGCRILKFIFRWLLYRSNVVCYLHTFCTFSPGLNIFWNRYEGRKVPHVTHADENLNF